MGRARLRALLLAMAAAACGSATPPPVDTGFDPATEVQSLSPGDLVSVCTGLRNGIAGSLSPAEVQKLECLILAAGAFTVTECQTTFDACRTMGGVGLGNPLEAGLADCVEMDLVAAAAGCTATIGELEACSSESIDRTRANIAGTSCTNIPGLNLDEPFQGPTCDEISVLCPGLLD